MPSKDLLGAIELLQQHAANQEMRPRHPPERQCRGGAVEDRGAQTIGSADREGEFAHTLVTPRGEPISEIAA
jgi:hypothetical protein